MKSDLDRVKNDLETMQKALGLTPSFGHDWLHWLKRDNWLNLWWCLPGVILIAASMLPLDDSRKFLGLVAGQWVGLLVTGVLLGMLVFWGKLMKSDARPPEVVREYKRINAQGSWFLVGFLVQFVLYLVWGKQHDIGPQAFMAGIWLLSGSSVLLLAVVTKAWVFLGWAVPLLAFGLCQPLLQGRSGGLWLGLMFIVAAVLCSIIQASQFRAMEKQHVAD
jgi:hypothetical protein